MKQSLVTFILLALLSLPVTAASNNISFRYITMQDGLSNNKVNNVYRDEMGFVWFSTSCGLNRYDGYTMTVFLHSNTDSTSLDDNTVLWVHDLTNDKLLVKTSRGHSIFDKQTERFSSAAHIFDMAHVNEWRSVSFVDSRGDLWLSDSQTCSIYSTERGIVSQRGLTSGTDSPITTFCESAGNIYFIHSDGTISICTKDASGTWQVTNVEKTPIGNGIHRIFVDNGGDYWVTVEEQRGVWHKSAQTGRWEKLTSISPEPYRMPEFVVAGIVEDADGRIWVASDHGGINVLDRRKGKTIEVRSRKSSPRSLMSNGISCIYADKQGCVWVGDVSSGVSYYAEPIFKFDYDNLKIDDIDPSFVAQINAILEDENGNLWYGTNENGLLRVDGKTGRKSHFKMSESDANTLASDIVVALSDDGQGGLWVGTFLGGLCHYDGKKFQRFRKSKDVTEAAASDNVWAICRENEKLWIGSLSSGLSIYDDATKSWTKINVTDGLPNNHVMKIVSMRDGRMAVGTTGGLCIVDSRKDDMITIVDGFPQANSSVTDLCYDSRGLLWVCTNGGLNIIDGKSLKLTKHLDRNDGFQTDAMLGVVEDKNRNIWILTANGMTSVNIFTDERHDSTNVRLYNYNVLDGFHAASVNERAITCTSDGSIIVGGANGVNVFNPSDISYNKEKPQVRFTSLSTFGQPATIDAKDADAFSLPVALPFTDAIEIPHDMNMFTIAFSTLSNILPQKVTYTYKLEGFNKNWITTKNNYATYTNLAPGDYLLVVKATNCDGIASDTAATLAISILPPWWRTYWAYAVYTLLVIAAIFFSIKWIRDRDKAKFRMRQIISEVEKQKQLDDMKLKFFTNISHELRTPLSLIISPLENILETLPADDQNRPRLELIHRNSQKLLNIVNQLLDFRKADKGGMTLNLSEGDLVSFASDLSDSFVKLSNKDIKFSFSSNVPNAYMRFDKDKMSKIIDNLLSNAYKFTPAGGSVAMTVSLADDHEKAYIVVSDSGIGIPDKHKGHIFERFYQVPQTDTSIVGSGIGLHLVKEFVTMHGGEISVSDNPTGGTVFTVELPTSADALPPSHAAAIEGDDDIMPDDEQTENEEKQGRPKIAIVDDNDDFLTLLRDTLRSEYDIIEAHNGAEAYEMILEDEPNLIITDVMMPVMDGNELCSKIKSDIRTSHIPLIMLTARTAEEHNIEGLTNGADDYLTKPFNPQILRLRVDKLIELGQKRQQTFKNQIDPEPSEITITPLDEQLIQKAISYVEANIASPSLSVEDMSRHLGMSRVHLYKKLISITGRPPIVFIRVIRLKRAAQMLKDPAQNVADVAYAVGFNNPKYFSKYFREEFGVLPSKYCQSLQQKDSDNDANGGQND